MANPKYKVIGFTKIRKYGCHPTRLEWVFKGPRGGKFRLQPCGRRLYLIRNFYQVSINTN